MFLTPISTRSPFPSARRIRNNGFARVALIACLPLLLATSAFGHGDVHIQIDELTPKIKQAPTAELHLKRGELYRLDENFTAALADFEQAAKLDPKLDTVSFCKGRVLFEAGELKLALEVLNSFLAKKPSHIEGHMVRARAHFGLKEHAAAVEDYDSIVSLIDEPTPDCFLERAESLSALGRKEAAIKSLNEGIERLGNLLALQKAAIDLEVDLKRYDDALGRLDRVMATLQRKEVWLSRRGEILDAAGRREEALRAFGDALTALDQLSPLHRKAKPMRELAAVLQDRVGKDSTQDHTQPSTN